MNWLTRVTKGLLQTIDTRGSWWGLVREPFPGAWQQNASINMDTVLAFHAVYSCVTLIASDIGKLPFNLVRQDRAGIWSKITDRNYSPVLAKPNRSQNHIQIKEWWVTSKLIRGNTYILKQRDRDGYVVRLHVLDPSRVTVLVAPDGSVFYQLINDNLSGLESSTVTVPQSEIIHDRMNCIFHPLVGVSPLFACALAASQGIKIQTDSEKFYTNGANPSGVLTAPGAISDATAMRLKTHWESGYTGANAGKVAVLGDGLKFEPMRMTATDAQMIETLRWTAEVVCSTFHVPAYKIGVGALPTYNNIEALTQDYYSQCLQSHIEQMETALDDGLEMPGEMGVELDLDVLFRMDSATKIRMLAEGIRGAIYAPNEARLRMNLPPLDGGDSVYMQQQNYSLEALAKREEGPALAIEPAQAPQLADNAEIEDVKLFLDLLTKRLREQIA